jgi:hypothetical protein
VLLIRIGFNADPEPGSQRNPDPGLTLKPQNVELYMKNIHKVGTVPVPYYVNKHTYEGKKAYLKGRKPVLFVDFAHFLCFWIRIRICITNTHTDPEMPNQCGSGSTTLFPTYTQCQACYLMSRAQASHSGRLCGFEPDALSTCPSF